MLVFVLPGRKPWRQVFSWRGSDMSKQSQTKIRLHWSGFTLFPIPSESLGYMSASRDMQSYVNTLYEL